MPEPAAFAVEQLLYASEEATTEPLHIIVCIHLLAAPFQASRLLLPRLKPTLRR